MARHCNTAPREKERGPSTWSNNASAKWRDPSACAPCQGDKGARRTRYGGNGTRSRAGKSGRRRRDKCNASSRAPTPSAISFFFFLHQVASADKRFSFEMDARPFGPSRFAFRRTREHGDFKRELSKNVDGKELLNAEYYIHFMKIFINICVKCVKCIRNRAIYIL